MSIILLAKTILPHLNIDQSLLARSNIALALGNEGGELVAEAARVKADVVVVPYAGSENAKSLLPKLAGLSSRPKVVTVYESHGDAAAAAKLGVATDAAVVPPLDTESIIDATAMVLGLPRRENVRILARLSAEVQDERRGNKGHFFGTIADISVSGMRLVVREVLQVGEKLTVEFFLPGSVAPCTTGAMVVRLCSGDAAVGLRFTEVKEETRALISAFVKRRRAHRVAGEP